MNHEPQPTTPLSHSTPADLQAALADWDLLRMRGWHNHELNRLPTAVSYLVRTVDRVLQLGRILGTQSRIFQGLQLRLDQTSGDLLQLEGRTAAMEGWSRESRDLIASTSAQQTRLSEQQIRLSEQQRDTAAALRQMEIAFAELQRRHRRDLSELRLLQQRLGSDTAPREDSGTRISDIDTHWLLQHLEAERPELREYRSVDLSIQDADAEVAVAAGVFYLGERMASSGEAYRVPNDLWYHIDFTPEWDRQVLFESARSRLARGGAFVLITEPDRTPREVGDGLEQVYANRISLLSGRKVQVYIWRRV